MPELTDGTAPLVYAVVVLYQMQAADSPTCQSLQACLNARPDLAGRMRLLVADNSPQSQRLPENFAAEYLHDGQNPGLALRYNQALARAVGCGAGWLLLLDDDTTLTEAWLAGLHETLRSGLPDEVAAVVPRLLAAEGTLLSPHLPAFRDSAFPLTHETAGILPGMVRVFNSGAALRCTMLQRMGGFDERFSLDSVDHATFHKLQALGGSIFLLPAALQHQLSVTGERPGRGPDRERNQLRAETLFLREHGSAEERQRRRNFLLREAFANLRKGQVRRARRLLAEAVRQACQIQGVRP